MKNKIVWIIFYILIIFAIGIMIMEYFEVQQYMVVCKEYNNRIKQNEDMPIVNITFPDELK